ncbi:MAG TPA: peptidylprolyl isomerase [Candidatus Sulfotelmatobacter sp.]|jgi:peptidyl-prolyl cis-trans isomerase B (cyclophilin B)|nr:peptidylprolyl isomerase [Candidatus Sulfotelmatobacter sp.]
MNKFHIALFSLIVAVFFGIIVTTEVESNGHKVATAPTLPPDASTFQLITPTGPSHLQQPLQGQQPQGQGQQSQQPQPGSQAYEQAAAALQGPIAASISATIKTSKGNINVILFGDKTPNTVRNFILKAGTNFYNGLLFHRVENWVVQGGDPKGDGTGGGQMGAEQTQKSFVIGSLGIARGSNPQINNDSQFFITKTDASWLDGQYTNFGIVTSGMSVVNNIQIGDKIEGITINQ